MQRPILSECSNGQPRCRLKNGSVMILFVLTLPVLLGLIGLAVDGTILYVVEAKLSASVDGAALGAGRLVGTDANSAEIANEFLKANFPANYWGSWNLQSTTNSTYSAGLTTITVNASVQVPLIFLRMFNMTSATVYGNAVATRRLARVLLVLDRSGSMNTTDPISGLNVFTEMQQGAEGFTGMFTPGYDELGLVVLSASALVAYPETRPYNPSPTSAGGPDNAFVTTPTSGPMFTQIQNLQAGGGTGTPEALALAYIELQKAHNRDYAANGGADNAQNVIVLFTDGVPDSIAVSPNNPSRNVLSPTSPCQYNPGSGTSSIMAGTIVTPGNAGNWSPPMGLFLLSAYSNTQTLTWWLENPGNGQPSTGDLVQSSPATALAQCAGLDSNGSNYSTWTDLTQIPPYDYYGTPTTGSAYTLATLDQQNGTSTQPYAGVVYNPADLSSGNNSAIAAWNAVDNIGNIIRSQTAMQPITIYTIGYSGDGGTDATLLTRLANSQNSTSYNSLQSSGLYIQVNSAGDLGSAFSAIASQVLRLAK